jgi:hypothetical protein
VYIPKFHQVLEFITNGTIGPILDVIGSLVSLAPFLEAVGGEADKACGAELIEDWVIVVCRQGPGLKL